MSALGTRAWRKALSAVPAPRRAARDPLPYISSLREDLGRAEQRIYALEADVRYLLRDLSDLRERLTALDGGGAR